MLEFKVDDVLPSIIAQTLASGLIVQGHSIKYRTLIPQNLARLASNNLAPYCSNLILQAGAFGIGEVITPVVDYLDRLYAASSLDAETGQHGRQGEENSQKILVSGTPKAEVEGTLDSDRKFSTEESLRLYRRLLDDGQAAAPGA